MSYFFIFLGWEQRTKIDHTFWNQSVEDTNYYAHRSFSLIVSLAEQTILNIETFVLSSISQMGGSCKMCAYKADIFSN